MKSVLERVFHSADKSALARTKCEGYRQGMEILGGADEAKAIYAACKSLLEVTATRPPEDNPMMEVASRACEKVVAAWPNGRIDLDLAERDALWQFLDIMQAME